jgi:hypothetical protein
VPAHDRVKYQRHISDCEAVREKLKNDGVTKGPRDRQCQPGKQAELMLYSPDDQGWLA